MALLVSNLALSDHKQVAVLHASARVLKASQHVGVQIVDDHSPNIVDARVADAADEPSEGLAVIFVRLCLLHPSLEPRPQVVERAYKVRHQQDIVDVALQRARVRLGLLDELYRDGLQHFESGNIAFEQLAERRVFDEEEDRVEPILDGLSVAEGLQQVGSEHTSASASDAPEVLQEAVGGFVGLGVHEELEVGHSLLVYYQHVGGVVPLDVQSSVLDVHLQIAFNDAQQGSQRGAGQHPHHSVFGVEVALVLVPSFAVYAIASCVVKQAAPDWLEGSVRE